MWHGGLTTWMSSQSSAAANSAATSPRSRRSFVGAARSCAARRRAGAPHGFDAPVVVDGDQATGIGFSTASGPAMRLSAVNVIGSPMAKASKTSQAASDKLRCGIQSASTKAARHRRIAGPVPEPMLFLEPAVGDLLLDDVRR